MICIYHKHCFSIEQIFIDILTESDDKILSKKLVETIYRFSYNKIFLKQDTLKTR